MIPYALNPDSIPWHGLRSFRYRCGYCERSFDFMLRPATLMGWMPTVGTSPTCCPQCGKQRTLRMINRVNVKRRKK